MAWQSSGGYPGVQADGQGGLLIVGLDGQGFLSLTGDGEVSANIVLANTVDSNVVVHAGDHLSTGGAIGLFNQTAPAAATVGGAATAGGTYTAVEQAMLEAVYTALRSIGLVT